MKTIKNKIILSITIGLLSMSIFGQDVREVYQKTVNDIFSNIPSEKITTGIQIERAPAIVDMFRYEVACKEKDTCNVRKWKQMYLQLNMAHLDSRKFNYDNRIVETDYLKNAKTNDIPIGIIFYDYNRINPYAFQNGLLSIDTVRGMFQDLSGLRGTPLETVTCFAASPMVDILKEGFYSFYIDPALFISNKTQSFDEFSIDFGDGRGFVSLPVNGRASANFERSGEYIITLKAVQKNVTYLSYSFVYVPKNQPLLRAAGANSERTPDILKKIITLGVNGIEAEYGIWYRCNHDNTIHKPFLIVSGFDPSDDIRVREENESDKDDKLYLYHVANKDGFLDRLRENGYDIIAWRSNESVKAIGDNALNLVELIKKINNEKTSNNELVVAGASMGGLVARYALTYMEKPNVDDHQTRLFISLDSPQNGANVPLGFQHMVSALNADLQGISLAVADLQKAEQQILGCAAAKQMLLYHHKGTSGATAKCDNLRTTYSNDLATIGNFPKKCQSIAISMGSGIGTGQGFSAGQTLLKKNPSVIDYAFLMSSAFIIMLAEGISGGIIPPGTSALISGSNLLLELEVSAVPNQSSKTIYRHEIKLKPCYKVLVPKPCPILLLCPQLETVCFDAATLYSRTTTVNNTNPIDNAPGSKKGFHNLVDFDKDGYSDLLNLLGVITKDPNNDCFIPAYSALGLSVSPHTHIKNYLNAHPNVEKINHNFYRNNNKTTVSPFDYLYIEDSNMYHIAKPDNSSALTSSMVTMMNDFLIPNQLNLDNRTINSSQSVAYEAENITVNGNFIVNSGGRLDMKANQITLKPGFQAKSGSTAHLEVNTSWICPAGSLRSVSIFPLSSLDVDLKEIIETEIEIPKEELDHLIVAPEIKNEVHLFPNPVEDILNMQILNKIEGEIKITIIDITGQTVYLQSIINDGDNAIDCSQFNSGVYLVNITFKDSVQTIKIIKK